MATKSEKARRELLALAERWRKEQRLAAWECGAELMTAIDRLFPVKPPAEPEPEEGHPIVTFPVLGGGVYGVGEAKVAELAKLYEVPVPFLLEQLGIVAAKLQAGAVKKKTRRGMARAVFAWTEMAKRIYDRRQELSPAPRAVAIPPAINGKPRVTQMFGETVAIYHGQTYRQSQWPAEYGPWPGGA